MIWRMILLFALLFGAFAYFLKDLNPERRKRISLQQLHRSYTREWSPERGCRTVGYVSVSMHQLRGVSSDLVVEETYRFLCQSLHTHLSGSPGDQLTRYEGRNFLFLTFRDSFSYLPSVACVFRDLEQYAREHDLQVLPRIHVGLCAASGTAVPFAEAVRRAKQASITGEEWGNRITHWDFEAQQELLHARVLAGSMADAIASDCFYLVFQPIVDIHTGTVVGGEVLSRMNHPQLGLIPPSRFIEAIDTAGLHAQFDYYIFNKACAWLHHSLTEGEKLRFLSCNFSRFTLSEPDAYHRICHIADHHRLDHKQLAIEITEEDRETDAEQVRQNLELLRQSGFQVFLDDFGSGISSLHDLQQYRVDMLKLDRSMLTQSDTPQGQTIFHSLIAIAVELDTMVLCEGVETITEKQFAQDSGCHYAQGFYYYRPMGPKEFAQLL